MPTPTRLIRNFSIIAHIDHGKSTLADRLLDATGRARPTASARRSSWTAWTSSASAGSPSRRRPSGSTYQASDGQTYELNLIDTPGHVDFHYEVSRSLAACEGAVLVVDASQGVEAQTLANVYLAVNNNLTIVPVINKIDLPAADPENVRRQIEEVIGIDASEAILASAKEGKGIHEILEAVVAKVPPPVGDPDKPLRGAAARQLVRHLPRRGHPGARRRRRPAAEAEGPLHGRAARLRDPDARRVRAVRARDARARARARSASSPRRSRRWATRASATPSPTPARPCAEPLPGFQPAKPMVFAGIFPTDTARYEDLRDALDKLRLNDASFTREPETSAALGFGFRCGFLGLLHMEIVQERLEREYNLDLITTAPDGALPLRAARTARSSSSTTPRNSPRKATSTASRSPSSPSPSTRRRNTWGASSSCARRSAARRRA